VNAKEFPNAQHGKQMSGRALWAVSLPLAALGWTGVVIVTWAVPPSPLAYAAVLPLLALAVAMTLAPLLWTVASRRRWAGAGERPALALRVGAWAGLWVAACAGLRLAGVFNWVIALALAVILTLVEAFLVQRQGR
jgi:hypothetical protein